MTTPAAATLPRPAEEGAARAGNVVRRVRLCGLTIDDMGANAVVARIAAGLASGQRLLVLNANAHLITQAQRLPWLREFFNRADIAFFDGAGPQLAAWMRTGMRPARTTPPEWADRVGALVASRGGSVFWLGGTAETAARAADIFSARHGVRTAGWRDGFFDLDPASADSLALVEQINAARPDILFVNMGMPRQERWLNDNWHRIDAQVAITAGALVDHVAGKVRRPPRWVADLGLEWAVRLAVEPRRLWRRYLLGLPQFGLLVVSDAVRPR